MQGTLARSNEQCNRWEPVANRNSGYSEDRITWHHFKARCKGHFHGPMTSATGTRGIRMTEKHDMISKQDARDACTVQWTVPQLFSHPSLPHYSLYLHDYLMACSANYSTSGSWDIKDFELSTSQHPTIESVRIHIREFKSLLSQNLGLTSCCS